MMKGITVKNYPALIIKSMDGKDWQPILNKGIEIIQNNELNCQIAGGTLLGMIREPIGYIKGDTDLDVEVFVNSFKKGKEAFKISIQKVIDEFLNNGFVLARTQYYKGLPMQIAFIFLKNKLIFDIYLYYDNIYLYDNEFIEKHYKDKLDYYNISEHGILLRPKDSVENTKLYEFNSVKYLIPLNHEEYLAGRFGEDWRTPKSGKYFDSKSKPKYAILY